MVSAESGADHPEWNPPALKNTALGATYACAGVPQLICVDVSAALTIAAASLAAAQRDLILVLVNDPTYGGSGGALAVASTHAAVGELVLHELGHSLGLLADEYGGPAPPACDAAYEPPKANATKDLIKWTSWIDPSTPIPTYTTAPGLPGLYSSAKYCDNTLFRPTYNSKMRSLGVPFMVRQDPANLLRAHRLWTVELVPDSEAPLQVTLSLNTTGSFDPKTGVATVGGTVGCNVPGYVSDVTGTLQQKKGRVLLTAGFSAGGFECTPPATAWSATATSAKGFFADGQATLMNVNSYACNEVSCDDTSTPGPITIQLSGQK